MYSGSIQLKDLYEQALRKVRREFSEKIMNSCLVQCLMCWLFYSPFISRLLTKDAGSGGGDQGGSSSYSSLGMCLDHGGDRLGGAECAADWTGYKAVCQNDPSKTEHELQTAHNSGNSALTLSHRVHVIITRFSFRLWLLLLLLSD